MGLKRIDSPTYIQLRLLVGYLGEKAQHGWWATDFLSPVARAFLEPSFPRTWRVAQYTAATEAARRVHDEHIGVGNVFHLFRFPEEIERQVHAHMLANPAGDGPFVSLADRDSAMQALEQFAVDTGTSKEGPINIGKLSRIRDLEAFRVIARHYRDAFERGNKVFPYFVGNG